MNTKSFYGVVIILFVAIITSCGESQHKYKIREPFDSIIISDFSYTVNNNPGKAIIVGHTDEEYFDFDIETSRIKQGMKSDKKDKSLSASATIKGKTFFTSSKHDTHAFLVFTEISADKAIFTFDVKLVQPDTEEYLEQTGTVTLTGEARANLFK